MDTFTAVKNDASKIKNSVKTRINAAAKVAAVGVSIPATAFRAAKEAVKDEFSTKELIPTGRHSAVTIEATK